MARLTMLGCLALTCLAGALADDPPAAQPDPEQWIAPIPEDVDVPMGAWAKHRMSRWVLWPTDDYIAQRQPPRDRSDPPADEWDRKRTQHTLAPRMARSSAAQWLKLMLKPELIPADLEGAQVLLQEEDPTQSWVACRFEVGGTGVQVAQRLWYLCVVVRPDPALIEGLAPEDIGPAVLRAVFEKGEEMAGAGSRAVPGLPEGVYGRSRAEVGRKWPDWGLWYTDGRSVAVYAYRYNGGQRRYRSTDPWS